MKEMAESQTTRITRMIVRIDIEIATLLDMGLSSTPLYQYVLGQRRILVDTPWNLIAVSKIMAEKGEF